MSPYHFKSQKRVFFWCWISPTSYGSGMYCNIDSFFGFDIVNLLEEVNEEVILTHSHSIGAVEVKGLYLFFCFGTQFNFSYHWHTIRKNHVLERCVWLTNNNIVSLATVYLESYPKSALMFSLTASPTLIAFVPFGFGEVDFGQGKWWLPFSPPACTLKHYVTLEHPLKKSSWEKSATDHTVSW